VADACLASQAVIFVARQLLVRVDYTQELAYGVVVERCLHVLSVGVADGLAVASAYVLVAVGDVAVSVGLNGLQTLVDYRVCGGRCRAVGQGDLHGAVVYVVLCERRVEYVVGVERGRVVGRRLPLRHLAPECVVLDDTGGYHRLDAVHHATSFGLHRASERVGEEVCCYRGLRLGVVVDGLGCVALVVVLYAYRRLSACLYLVGSCDGGQSPTVVVGIAHLVVEVYHMFLCDWYFSTKTVQFFAFTLKHKTCRT